MTTKRAKTVFGAYVKGAGTLLVGALGILGAVFAWRIANLVFDKMLENGKTGGLRRLK